MIFNRIMRVGDRSETPGILPVLGLLLFLGLVFAGLALAAVSQILATSHPSIGKTLSPLDNLLPDDSRLWSGLTA